MPDQSAQQAIFVPMLGMWLLTFVVWTYMYARRIPFIQQLDLPDGELTPATLARLSPPEVSNPSDNLKNLFELPVLFYAGCLYLYVSGTVDPIHLACAWVFLVFRVLHSGMHCTKNVVIVRFGLYAVSALALWVMLLRAALATIFNA